MTTSGWHAGLKAHFHSAKQGIQRATLTGGDLKCLSVVFPPATLKLPDMGVCMMVASGLNFDVDRFLRGSPFNPVAIFRKGQIPSQGNPGRIPRPDSGFLVVVSQDAEPGLARQIPELLGFLIGHEKEFGRLREAGMDNCLIQLAVESQGGNETGQYLPSEIIITLARFRMGLSFSVVHFPKG